MLNTGCPVQCYFSTIRMDFYFYHFNEIMIKFYIWRATSHLGPSAKNKVLQDGENLFHSSLFRPLFNKISEERLSPNQLSNDLWNVINKGPWDDEWHFQIGKETGKELSEMMSFESGAFPPEYHFTFQYYSSSNSLDKKLKNLNFKVLTWNCNTLTSFEGKKMRLAPFELA